MRRLSWVRQQKRPRQGKLGGQPVTFSETIRTKQEKRTWADAQQSAWAGAIRGEHGRWPAPTLYGTVRLFEAVVGPLLGALRSRAILVPVGRSPAG
jgi:hypothetical protein